MTKAYVFPGQGSQSVGMMKELYDTNPKSKEIFEKADEALGFKLTNIIFEGPEEELKKTVNTQPAILAASIAEFVTLSEKPVMVAGHSLGEYSALVAAEAISFEDAVKIVRLRGQFMEEAVPNGVGTMAAILGLADEIIEKVVEKIDGVDVANYNSPGQVVISGVVAGVEKACEELKEAGAKRAILLPVSGPFHSALIKDASVKLSAELEKITINDPKIPIIANVTADYVTTAVEVKELLVKQVYSSVLWTRSVEKMIADGVDEFVEVGPGNVLSGLIKKIQREFVTA